MPSSKLRLVLLLLLSSRASTFLVSPTMQNNRKRPRCKASTVESFESSSSDPLASPSSSASCPFSRVFPRYRVDLSTSREDKKKSGPLSVAIFTDLTKTWDQAKLTRANPGINIQWLKGLNGVEATAALWRRTADLASGSNDSVLLALPDATPKIVRQWTDTVQWMHAHQQLNNNDDGGIEAVYDDSILPTVRLRRRQRQDPDPSLTTRLIDIQDPAVVEKRMQSWVQRILVNLGICPFTKSITYSGQGLSDLNVPVARIAYHTSNAVEIPSLLADAWEAIRDMVLAGPSGKQGISSILLAAPAFDDDFDLWSGPVFAMLEAGVLAAGIEREIGIVCFHNQYATPDGSSWPGFGHMHSVPRLQQWLSVQDPTTADSLDTEEVAAGGAWQRRTPHATINVLRAEQLEAAEGRRTTGELYSENIRKLVGKSDGIGSDQLQRDLDRERSMI